MLSRLSILVLPRATAMSNLISPLTVYTEIGIIVKPFCLLLPLSELISFYAEGFFFFALVDIFFGYF